MHAFYISVSIVIVVILSFHVRSNIKCRQLMKNIKKSEEKYRDLEKKYEQVISTLENSVNEEVAKNRQKDLLLIQHSRLAAKGELIGSIGHQWQQPLNCLSLLIQDVREALQFGEINDQYIETFTKESMIQIKQMSGTINDFRKFYQKNKEKCIFSVTDSIEDALSIFSSNLKDHNIHVNFNYRGQHMAYGFPNEYSQVLLTILMNAKDAFLTNNVKDRNLDISIGTKDGFLTVDITDNAGGIEPALLSQVFEPYFTTKRDGTGIGLYMTKMVIENMNGSVQVINTEDGARFTLSVPKSAATEDIAIPV